MQFLYLCVAQCIHKCKRWWDQTTNQHQCVPIQHTYDLNHDLIRFHYFSHHKLHTVCCKRDLAPYPQLLEKLEHVRALNSNPNDMVKYIVLQAVLNDEEDITDRINRHLGHEASHASFFGPPKIEWILDALEVLRFDSLYILTQNFEEKMFHNAHECLSLT